MEKNFFLFPEIFILEFFHLTPWDKKEFCIFYGEIFLHDIGRDPSLVKNSFIADRLE